MEQGDLSLADAILAEVLLFFETYARAERLDVTLEEVDDRIDDLAVLVQTLDLARSNPADWPEYLATKTSSYDHLWPAEQLTLFLLANYAALHATLRKDLPLPMMSPQSIAHEVFLMDWLPHEATQQNLMQLFINHPASQPSREG